MYVPFMRSSCVCTISPCLCTSPGRTEERSSYDAVVIESFKIDDGEMYPMVTTASACLYSPENVCEARPPYGRSKRLSTLLFYIKHRIGPSCVCVCVCV